jgi:hypothetical protein
VWRRWHIQVDRCPEQLFQSQARSQSTGDSVSEKPQNGAFSRFNLRREANPLATETEAKASHS